MSASEIGRFLRLFFVETGKKDVKYSFGEILCFVGIFVKIGIEKN